MKQQITRKSIFSLSKLLFALLAINWSNNLQAQSSLHFDGTNDRVSIPHISGQVGLTSLTIEAWVRPEKTNGTDRNVTIKGNYGYGMIIDNSNKLGYWSNSSYNACPKFGNVPDNVWSHVAIVVVQNVSVTFYINGINVGYSTISTHTTINAGGNNPLFLGYQGTGCNCNYFKGAMDEVRLWNTARTQTQIRTNMNSQLSSQSGLFQLFNLNGGTPKGTNTGATAASDSSSSLNNGTLANFALTGNTSNWFCDFRNRMDVKGNNKFIANLDYSVSANDSTFFGNTINGSSIRRRFKIFNPSTTSLTISSITLSGTNAADFTITGAPSSIAIGDSATFTITYAPSVQRESFANVVINNNSCDAAAFTFGIKASYNINFSPLVVSTYTGFSGSGSTNGTLSNASFYYPTGLTRDKQGNFFVVEYGNSLVRKITPAGVVSTYAGNGSATFKDSSALNASFRYPSAGVMDTAGNLIIVDFLNNRIRKIDKTTQNVTTIAGNNTQASIDGTGTAASFAWPFSAAVDKDNNIFVADYAGHKIRKITPAGVVTTFASGTQGYQDATGTSARFNSPKGLAFDNAGNLFVCDVENFRIRKITPSGVVTTFAGNGVNVTADGNGTNASFNRPTGIAIDAQNNLYITEESGHIVRKITPDGDVTTIAGTGVYGFLNGAALSAKFSEPNSIVVLPNGDLYVSENAGHKIRKIGKGFTEINVNGNDVTIVDGDITPTLLDSTNLGSVLSGSIKRRYKINNVGGDTLKIASIVSSGSNASEFVITGAPSRILAGDSAMFTITFTPTALGIKTATITINSNDLDEAAFDFAIEATKLDLGKSLHFDGSNDNVRVNHNSALNPSTAMTLETWVYRTADKHATIISKYDDDGNNRGYMINFGEFGNNKKVNFIATTNGSWTPSPKIQWETNTELNLNQWYHIAFTFTQNGTNNVKYYVDGELKDQTTWNFSINTTLASLFIGGYDGLSNGFNSGANSRFFAGNLDEVRIWNYERTCGQISATMNCELLGTESGLVSYYNFNQGIGASSNPTITTLTDNTSNAFNGTLNNFALTSNTSNWVSSGGSVVGNTPKLFPEINLKGNTLSIIKSDIMPSTTDSTSFGSVANNTKRRFTIENTGTDTLKISSIVLSGTNSSSFTISNAPTYILAGASAQFIVNFNAISLATQNATITINNNDCDEAAYDFAIQAEVACAGTLSFDQLGLDINGEASNDQFGYVISMSGDGQSVAIGANENAGGGTRRGHVRIYKKISGTWTQQGADIDGEADDDESGKSVALSSDGLTVAIGAPGNAGGGFNRGNVRIFKFNGIAWIQLGLDIKGEADNNYIGESIAISADGITLAIGASRNAGGGTSKGSVRIFKIISGTWTQQGININGEADNDRSGYSVSLTADGSIVAIGSQYNAGGGTERGHVRVYKNISGTWTQQGGDIDGEADVDRSGYTNSISSDGLTIAVGAIYNPAGGGNRGHVRVYKLISSAWVQQGTDIDGEANGDASGWSLSLSADGSVVAIGSRFNPAGGIQRGHVRIYKNMSGVWTKQGVNINGEADNDNSGNSVSLSADGLTLAIGAFYNDGGGANSGHVRVYQLNCVNCNLSSTLPTTAGTYTSTQTGLTGTFNCYCDVNGKLLLALDLTGSGAVIPSNGVSLQIGATATTAWNNAGGIISNANGGAIFNRKWNVAPITQPTSPVKVKYFFTNTEYDSVVARIAPLGTTITSPTQLEMYKLLTGLFADPHASTATGIILTNGATPTTTKWAYSAFGTNHSAEFLVSSFSGGGGGAGGGSVPLPVSFISFTAKGLSNTSALLKWQTASEINNSYFNLERSLDGINFDKIGKVIANGNVQGSQNYTFIDKTITTGTTIAYYRIKQVDLNGQNTSTSIELVNFNQNSTSINVYPNPFSQTLTLNLQNEESANVTVLDATGKIVFKSQVTVANNTLNLTNLSSGIYNLVVTTNGIAKHVKIIKI